MFVFTQSAVIYCTVYFITKLTPCHVNETTVLNSLLSVTSCFTLQSYGTVQVKLTAKCSAGLLCNVTHSGFSENRCATMEYYTM